jgi:hypothetical protein
MIDMNMNCINVTPANKIQNVNSFPMASIPGKDDKIIKTVMPKEGAITAIIIYIFAIGFKVD